MVAVGPGSVAVSGGNVGNELASVDLIGWPVKRIGGIRSGASGGRGKYALCLPSVAGGV